MSYLDDEELKIGSIEEEDLGLDDDLGTPLAEDFIDDSEDLEPLADLNGSEF